MSKIHALILFLFLLPFTVAAEKWTPETLPMVHLQDARRYICNPDGILSEQSVKTGDLLLQSLEKDKGVETVVVVVKQLEGNDPYQFGMDLARKYGIGSKKQDTGLIIILAVEDRKYQILTGNGLEGTLPDAICRRIQNRVMVPELKKKNWDAAIVQTLKSVDGYVRGDESLKAELEEKDSLMNAFLGFSIAMIVFGGCIFIIAVVSHKHQCPRCKHASLHVVKRQRVRLKGSGEWYIRTTLRCPRCGYETTRLEEDNDFTGGSMVPPILMGGMGRGGGSGFSGGSFGGSFGGGSFGGGGSGGSF